MKRALVAEDDEANRVMLTRVLESNGYVVVGVANGVEVLNELERAAAHGETFDALLLDWMMPMLSGIEVLAEVRHIAPELPVIMLTARASRDDVLGAFQLGADDYIVKPFDADVLLARLDARIRGAARRAHADKVAPLETGFVIDGRYQLTEQIGSGAFGVVYRARHLTLETDVAVKMLKADPSSSASIDPIDSLGKAASKKPAAVDGAEEFRREGVRACRVKHDNAVRIFDFGVLPSGKAYLVMELLRGRTLDAELRAVGKLPLARAVDVMKPVLDCLAAAHAQSVVHRDIKPANIFLHQGVQGDVTKVLDFGVAKLLESDGAITRDMIPGSPSYMAPERLRGAKYDGRSDVYSAGVTLYELLTGQVPFRAEGRDIYAVALKHLREAPVPPSKLVPGLPSAIDDVVIAMLAKQADQRPTAAEALAMLAKVAVPATRASPASTAAFARDFSIDIEEPSETALVVDDDLATRYLITRALQELHIGVAPFDDAESALAQLKVVRPAFALVDVNLPGMGGLELARRIAADDELRAAPLLVMSAAGGAKADAHERDALALGATFLTKPFRLAVFNEAMRELRAERERRRGERKKRRVLIVDDDDGIRDALKNIVGEEGFEPVCAADAFEALSLCGANAPRPDVAVIDVMLPGLDGPGLAARLKATKHLGSVPIVLISAFDSLHSHAARIGATAMLKKPFDLVHFIELLRRTVAEAPATK